MANMMKVIPKRLKLEKCPANTTPLHVSSKGIKTQRS